MKLPSPIQIVVLATIALLLTMMLAPGWNTVRVVSAQSAAVETTVTEPATDTPTATPTDTPVATDTPTATPTDTPVATATSTQVIVTLPPDTVTPVPPTAVPPAPVPIPEPVTVVLFGTGLAALSAAVASRRKNGQ
ncbi:MAG: PEP-CTERM sorting domain-containing protein [Caldilineaceae bacterium]